MPELGCSVFPDLGHTLLYLQATCDWHAAHVPHTGTTLPSPCHGRAATAALQPQRGVRSGSHLLCQPAWRWKVLPTHQPLLFLAAPHGEVCRQCLWAWLTTNQHGAFTLRSTKQYFSNIFPSAKETSRFDNKVFQWLSGQCVCCWHQIAGRISIINIAIRPLYFGYKNLLQADICQTRPSKIIFSLNALSCLSNLQTCKLGSLQMWASLTPLLILLCWCYGHQGKWAPDHHKALAQGLSFYLQMPWMIQIKMLEGCKAEQTSCTPWRDPENGFLKRKSHLLGMHK